MVFNKKYQSLHREANRKQNQAAIGFLYAEILKRGGKVKYTRYVPEVDTWFVYLDRHYSGVVSLRGMV